MLGALYLNCLGIIKVRSTNNEMIWVQVLANERMFFLIKKREKNKKLLVSLFAVFSGFVSFEISLRRFKIASDSSRASTCFLFPPSLASVTVYGLFPAPKSLSFSGFAFVLERLRRFNLDLDHFEPWKPVSSLYKFSQFVELDSPWWNLCSWMFMVSSTWKKSEGTKISGFELWNCWEVCETWESFACFHMF